VASAASPQRLGLSLGDEHTTLSSPAVFVFDEPPGEPLVAERVEPLPPTQEGGHAHVRLPIGERMTVGYLEHRNKGRLLVLGVSPTPELMVALHAWLGVPVASRAVSGSARVHSALFRRGAEQYFAVLTNTSDDVRDVRLLLDVEVECTRARDLRSGCEAPVVEGGVTLQVPARSGTAIQFV
jgi:hypothetical protein